MKQTRQEMPYERFLEKGADSLSDAELLAIIIRSGIQGESSLEIAKQILNLCEKEDLTGLYRLQYTDLIAVRGIGKVKAIKILCISEFCRRISKKRSGHSCVFTTPEQIADYYMQDLRHLEKEKVILLLFDGKNRLIDEVELSVGTANSSPVSNREIFKEALRKNAVYIILLHNHPSGDSTPSTQDIKTTKKLYEAAQLMNIPLLDHIIIGDCEYTSFKDKALI